MTNIYVFDTNSLVSAHLLSASIPRQALDKAFERGLLVYSKETFSEFVEVLTRTKFDKYLPLHDRLHVINLLETRSQMIEVTMPVIACRDPKDNKFLSLASGSC